jgi:hypothetical protein
LTPTEQVGFFNGLTGLTPFDEIRFIREFPRKRLLKFRRLFAVVFSFAELGLRRISTLTVMRLDAVLVRFFRHVDLNSDNWRTA